MSAKRIPEELPQVLGGDLGAEEGGSRRQLGAGRDPLHAPQAHAPEGRGRGDIDRALRAGVPSVVVGVLAAARWHWRDPVCSQQPSAEYWALVDDALEHPAAPMFDEVFVAALRRERSACQTARLASAGVSTPDPHEAPAEGGEGLTEREREILAFEHQWWKYSGAKEQAVHDLFGLSATRYYQVLNGLIDRPEALVHDPMLVKRLRRLRANRQAARGRLLRS